MGVLSHLNDADFVSLIANGVFAVVATYIAIALILYVLAKCRRRRTSNGIRASRLLRYFCISAAVFALLHHFIVFASFFVSNETEAWNETERNVGKEMEACSAFGILWLATYALGLLATYIFLWTRQHTLNTNINLPDLRRKIMLFLSWSSLVILVLGIVMVFLAGSRLIHFTSCNNDRSSHQQLYTIILSGILVSLTVIGQGQLLALFIFPLVHQYCELNVGVRKTRQQGSNTNNFNQIAIVKRCIVAAIACVITDVAAAVVTFTVQHPAAQLIYDFNLLINVICCVFIFPNWTRMLFPCRRSPATTASSSADVCIQMDQTPSNQSR